MASHYLKWIYSFFLFCTLSLFGQEIAVYDAHTDSFTGPEEEIAYIEDFPFNEYKVYQVPNLGAFYLDLLTDSIKKILKQKKPWEPEINQLFKQYIKPGTTAVDLGAHIGTHTIAMSKYAKKVIAFEPQKKIFRELVMNLKLNSCKNVIAYRCAIADEEKEGEMWPVIKGNEGGTGLGSGGERVMIYPLDAFNLTNISFMKIDVENAEEALLNGARKTIADNHPVILIEILGNFEYTPEECAKQRGKIINILKKMGYTVTHYNRRDFIAVPFQVL